VRQLHAVVEFPRQEMEKGGETSGIAVLQAFLEERRRRPDSELVEDLEKFEEQLHALFVAAEREALGVELARLDIDRPTVEVGGVVHRQVERCGETYFSAVGPVRVERSLYSTRAPGERAICPMELRAGMVEGRWTPLAAKQAIWVVAHLTPGEGEELFKRMGNMTPSKSSLDRLPKQVSSEWEAQREAFEATLRRQEVVPKKAVAMAVSLDGVMLRIEDPKTGGAGKTTAGDKSDEKAAAIEAEVEKEKSGPRVTSKRPEPDGKMKKLAAIDDDKKRNPYHEAACGTVALYDGEGDVLSVIRMARMPEKGKKTLKAMLLAEATAILVARPDLIVEALADGAKDNWKFLSKELPKIVPKGTTIIETLDFFHGAEHLEEALTAYYGDKSKKRSAQFEKLRHILRHEEDGHESVTRSLRHLADEKPQSKVLRRELKYFRRNRKRMKYAELKAKKLPIGTGIQEAACKTLVVQRARRSGICWGPSGEGGQAILTFRSLAQSDRFDRAWDLLRQTYVREVTIPRVMNVISIRSPRQSSN
jgi:hypothetical protein